MERLNDGVHYCSRCNLFPCSTQPFIRDSHACPECPVKQHCCYMPLVPLLPCELESGKIKTEDGRIAFGSEGWCYAFDTKQRKCGIEEIKPIACRVASCRWIRENDIIVMK